MTHIRFFSSFMRRYSAVKSHPKTPEMFHWMLSAGVCIYALLMPYGQFFRELGGALSFIGLLGVYAFGWSETNIRHFPLRWVYAALITFLLFKVFHTLDTGESWYAFKTNAHKGFIFFLASIEFVKSRKRAVLFAMLLASSAFTQGIDGMWQSYTGTDFLYQTPIQGERLTGTMGNGRVGNYMAMTLLPSIVLYFLLPKRWSVRARLGITALFLIPGCYLWIFAKARSGYLGLLAGVALLAIILRKIRFLHAMLSGLLLSLCAYIGIGRFSLDTMLSDVRFTQIWPSALEVFHAFPWFGAGPGNYRLARESLGIELLWEGDTLGIPHPHNIYMQFLSETGVVGTLLFSLFLFGTAVWAGYIIYTHSKEKLDGFMVASAALWASYAGGYLVTACGAHSFFRTWWTGTALLILGVVVGCCLLMRREAAEQ